MMMMVRSELAAASHATRQRKDGEQNRHKNAATRQRKDGGKRSRELQGGDRAQQQHHRAGRRKQMAVGMGFALPMQPTRWSHALCSIEQEFVARAPPYRCVNGRQPTSIAEGMRVCVCACVRACVCVCACGCACRYAAQPGCSLKHSTRDAATNAWSWMAPRLRRPWPAKSAVRGTTKKDRQPV